MLQSIYTALTGMRAQQNRIDVIGNNMANISTTAFKTGRVGFADTLYALMKPQDEATGTLLNGTGALVSATHRVQDQGTSIVTGNTLDFMVSGAGYFSLAGPDGQRYYTRDGSFKSAVYNNTNYLVSAEGYFVLGTDNQPIQIPGDSTQVAADGKGNLFLGGTAFASLQIAVFPNPEGLADVGGNRYQATNGSGAAAAAVGAAVQQGWLEGSNVDMATEIAKLMESQRAYSVLGTAIRTTDEMESTANRLGE